jgi:hypothetical protein
MKLGVPSTIFVGAMACTFIGLAIAASVEACAPQTPAQAAANAQVIAIVETDIAAGKSFGQTVTDVGAYLVTQPGAVAADVVSIVTDIIQYLIDFGILSPSAMTHAKVMMTDALNYNRHTPAAGERIPSPAQAPHAPSVLHDGGL